MPADVSAAPPHAQFAKCNCVIHRIYSEILSHFKRKYNKVVQIIQIYFLLPIFFVIFLSYLPILYHTA